MCKLIRHQTSDKTILVFTTNVSFKKQKTENISGAGKDRFDRTICITAAFFLLYKLTVLFFFTVLIQI